LKKEFFKMSWAQNLLQGIDEEILNDLEEAGILKVHLDNFSKLPEGAVILGSSGKDH
jgi:GMP synthase-like glutamine amidotransferase